MTDDIDALEEIADQTDVHVRRTSRRGSKIGVWKTLERSGIRASLKRAHGHTRRKHPVSLATGAISKLTP
jgi:hypothetical protein